MDWIAFPKNVYVEALIPNVMQFRAETRGDTGV